MVDGIILFVHPPVAKLDIASDSDSEGRGFESLRAGQKRSNFWQTKVTSFFYPSRRLGISSRFSVYIIAVGVYHHAERVFMRLDDIQGFALMIYRLTADDIHAFGVMGMRRRAPKSLHSTHFIKKI